MNVNEVVRIFCQYGFRKASMEDIASAAGLSRQSIYKKFGSKEGVFEWAITALTEAAFAAAMAELENEQNTPKERIIRAFDRWVGDAVPLVTTTPHGTEMLDMALATFQEKGHLGEAEFYSAVEELINRTGLANNPDHAADMTYTLATCSKGLILRIQTVDAFHEGIARAMNAMVQ